MGNLRGVQWKQVIGHRQMKYSRVLTCSWQILGFPSRFVTALFNSRKRQAGEELTQTCTKTCLTEHNPKKLAKASCSQYKHCPRLTVTAYHPENKPAWLRGGIFEWLNNSSSHSAVCVKSQQPILTAWQYRELLCSHDQRGFCPVFGHPVLW